MTSSVLRKLEICSLRARTRHPVIDTDLAHHRFTLPRSRTTLPSTRRANSVDQFREGHQPRFGYLNKSVRESAPTAAAQRAVRPPWWALPTKNTYASGERISTATLHEANCRAGTTRPSVSRTVKAYTHVGDADMRRALIRAVNELPPLKCTAPYADRLHAVAAIFRCTSRRSGIEELDYANH